MLMWVICGGGRVDLDFWYSSDIIRKTHPYEIITDVAEPVSESIKM